ncbi:hypothetical protein ASY01nite_01680 [Acetobacter syzygii]|uniref:DUF1178 family protein n=1 Tax=Acetobacter syzygii TaxID=146476 RepID=UPI0005DCEF6B|nr:DUF1178 family protein [Acetobacter syzygii]GAN71220.1 hypothetical protein Absy_014_096 [Acetobacter syzygii]GBR63551.1 hypothetical protein AA0483_0928 [Acetobacter syzygii NRIC 0483]GEL55102.1 hypothetical protein ASY01nite_01680 [Acetobacter syzygii]
MICYRLRCANDHVFEGWYKDSSTFAMLRQKGLLSCMECGTSAVDQAPMAPAIVGRGRSDAKEAPEAAAQAPPSAGTHTIAAASAPHTPSVVPDALLGALREMRREVEEKCENVGRNFADEALRIHYGEAPERGIYGEMSETQREELEEEGVAFHNIPWVRDTDS